MGGSSVWRFDGVRSPACGTLLPFDWCDQPVSAARQSLNVLRVVGIVVERLAQDRYRNVDAPIEFHHGIVRPKNLLYFLAGNKFALALHQDSQNLEGLIAEQNLCGSSFRSRRSDRDKFTGSGIWLQKSRSESLGPNCGPIHPVVGKLPRQTPPILAVN